MITTELLEARRLLSAIYGPDPTFGTNGSVNVLSSSLLYPGPNGKIVVAGRREVYDSVDHDSDGYETIYTRLNSDGSIDKTFGQSGRVITEPSEKGPVLTVAGTRLYSIVGPDAAQPLIQAQDIDLNPDRSFDRDGVANVPFSLPPSNTGLSQVDVQNIFPQSDGGVVIQSTIQFLYVGNTATPDLEQLVKLKADGSLDTSFGSQGFFNRLSFVANTGIYDFSGNAIRRYTLHGGQLDTSFGNGGLVSLSSHTGLAIEESTGKIVYEQWINGSTPRLYRLNTDGSFDRTFGTGGSISFPRKSTPSVQLDSQDRIVVGANNRLYRFSADGELDVAPFNGESTINDGPYAFDSMGRILAKGSRGIVRFTTVKAVQLASNGTLNVVGDGSDDLLSIYRGGGNRIAVTLNGNTTTFAPSSVKTFNVQIGDGNNRVDLSYGLPSTIVAGNGNDTIFGGAANDLIEGGDGNDSLDGGAGNDQIFGDAGNDTVDGDIGIDTIHGGTGDDLMVAYDRAVDQVFGDAGTNIGDVDSTDRVSNIQSFK